MSDAAFGDALDGRRPAPQVVDESNVFSSVRDMTLRMIARQAVCGTGLQETLDCVFLSVVVACRDGGKGADDTIAQSFGGIEGALIEFARALRLAVLRLPAAQDAELAHAVRAAVHLLATLENAFLDAAETAAEACEPPGQQVLLRHVAEAKTKGTRLAALASAARRDMADQFGHLIAAHRATLPARRTERRVSEMAVNLSFALWR